MQNDEKLLVINKKSCGVHITIFSKHDCPFFHYFIILHEEVSAYMNKMTRQSPIKSMKFIPGTQNAI